MQGNLDISAPPIATPLGVTKGGTGTTTQFTIGSVVFAGTNGVYTQDNTNFFWDDSNDFLRVPKIVGGTATTDDLILQSTTGNAASGSWIFFKVGNNGGTTAMEINHLGQIGIGTTGVVLVDKPLTIYGAGSDIGYILECRSSDSGGAYLQMKTGTSANAQAGFSWYQATNNVEWRMAVLGNGGNSIRWGTASSQELFFFETDGRMSFGGRASASFPGFKRSSAELQLRLSDDSDYAVFGAKSYKANGTAGATAGPFTTITSITVVGGIVTAISGS